MKIISQSKVVEIVTHRLFFQAIGCSVGTGYSFECSEDGTIDLSKVSACGQDSYNKVKDNRTEYLAPVVETSEHSYTEPRIGRCDCGCEVWLDRFTNTCESCGIDYNSAGQELAPRDQWGEETGESLSDILNIG